MSKTVTENTCNMCTPLGACLALKGVENCVSMLHGSQGCATYMRRFLIGHFREPMDIASTSFTEESAIFGGALNLKTGLDNLITQYEPEVIAIASTCLSETIGDDIGVHLKGYTLPEAAPVSPEILSVSTPSYSGNHIDGFYAAVHALVDHFASGDKTRASAGINLFAGMLSCEDLRYLKAAFKKFNLPVALVPDYSKTLDGGAWKEYKQIPPGGTSVLALQNLKNNQLSVECRSVKTDENSASSLLESRYQVPAFKLHTPIGLTYTDAFWQTICEQTGIPMPPALKEERERLIDGMGDSHKYVALKNVLLYGDLDFILPMAKFLTEVGLRISILATGNADTGLSELLAGDLNGVVTDETTVMCDTDFKEVEAVAAAKNIDIMVGNSRGYKTARALGLPMVRVGMPIHDRMGGQRKLHVGYKGALSLLDEIANTLIEVQQTNSSVGYSNM